jgi:hypothetical protein
MAAELEAHSSLAVLEILDHVLKRVAADMNRTREGMIDRHDHEHEHRQDAGHHDLSRQILGAELGAEKEGESHGEHGTGNEDRP